MNEEHELVILRVAEDCVRLYCRETNPGFIQFKMKLRYSILRHITDLEYWERALMRDEIHLLTRVEYGKQIPDWAPRTNDPKKYFLPTAILWLMWEIVNEKYIEGQQASSMMIQDYSTPQYLAS